MDGKDIAALVLSLVGASIAVSNWRAAWFRSKLKDDLDILKRYREEFAPGSACEGLEQDAPYAHLRDKIQGRMVKAYVLRGPSGRIFAGVGCLAVAIGVWLLTGDAWSAKPAWRFAILTVPVVAAAAFLWEAFEDRNEVKRLNARQNKL